MKLPDLQHGLTQQGMAELQKALSQGANAESLMLGLDEQMAQAQQLRGQQNAVDSQNPWMGIGDVLSNAAGNRNARALRPERTKQRGLVAAAKAAKEQEEARKAARLDQFKLYGAGQKDRDYNRGVEEFDRTFSEAQRLADRAYARDVKTSDREYDRDVVTTDREFAREGAGGGAERKPRILVHRDNPKDFLHVQETMMEDGTVDTTDMDGNPLPASTLNQYKEHKEFNPNSGLGAKRGKAYGKKDSDAWATQVNTMLTTQNLADNFDKTKAQAKGMLPTEVLNDIVTWVGTSGIMDMIGEEEFAEELAAKSQYHGDMVKLLQAPERHELYGAALTKSEQALFKRGDWLDVGNPRLGERLHHMALVKSKYLMRGLEREIIRQSGVPQDKELLLRDADNAGFAWDEGTKRLVRKDGLTKADINEMIDAAYDPKGHTPGQMKISQEQKDKVRTGLTPDQQAQVDALSAEDQAIFYGN